MTYTYRTFGFGNVLTPVVKRLLIANAVVFGVTLLVGKAFVGGTDFIYNWFAFQPTRIFTRPWGVFTYMFIHAGFMHIAVNMLALFFFGAPLEERWGSREFFKYYVICGLGGVALSYVFLPNAIVGASAAVFGVMLAFAMIWPDSPIYIWAIFPVKAKWLVAFFFVVNLASALSEAGGGVAYLAHVGGFITGLIYLKSRWRPGRSMRRQGRPVRARRMAIVPGEERGDAPRAEASPGRREDKSLYDAVDAVLDKISAEGMAALTPEELKLLDEVSRRHRSN